MHIGYVPNHLGDPTPFLDELEKEIKQTGIDISTLFLDHICYRTNSYEDYEQKKELLEGGGTLLQESKIGGRNIAVYKLFDPIIYKDRIINILELPAPKLGSFHKTGWEHVEFVIPEALESFYLKYAPQAQFITKGLQKKINADLKIKFNQGIACKFHTQPLEQVIEHEKTLS